MHKQNKIFQVVLTCVFIVFSFLIIFPFWLLVSASLTDANELAQHGYQIWPKTFDFSSYLYVFKNPERILRAYWVTFIFSVVSMVLSVLLTAMVAYPLSRKHLRGRNIINFYLYFTMLFSGGLVPTYLVVAKYLNLDDSIWVYILPGAVSAWNVFMMRTFFAGIPGEVIESAKVDGASEYKIFGSMVIPMSKPVIATVGLMVFLGKWNDWNTALIYISEPELYSLQYLLQSIMENINMLKQNPEAASMMQEMNIPSETIRMAMAVVVAGPALLVFPFFQKYFVKGLTVGAVKG